MGTVAKDPFAIDRPGLPPGGNPAMDRAYEGWLRATCEAANRDWCDRHFPALPDRELVRPWQLNNHLFKWLVGRAFPSGEGPNFLHRLRYVAVQYHYRRAEIEAEAARYIESLAGGAALAETTSTRR